jgi:hypothetical protein
MTHPLNREIGCVLRKQLAIPADQTTLRLVVTHDHRGDWLLIVKADGKEVLRKPISPETVPGDWTEIDVDLSEWAGTEVDLELINQADGWQFEAAYWAAVELR